MRPRLTTLIGKALVKAEELIPIFRRIRNHPVAIAVGGFLVGLLYYTAVAGQKIEAFRADLASYDGAVVAVKDLDRRVFAIELKCPQCASPSLFSETGDNRVLVTGAKR